MRTMTMTRTTTLSFCAEPGLLDRLEQVRIKKMKKAGYLSRSAVIRMLLEEGLEASKAAN